MKRVFADTSFYVATINEQDSFYEAVNAFMRIFRGVVITSEYVLVELGNWFAKTSHRKHLAVTINHIVSEPTTIVVAATRSLLLEGVRLYDSRPDKGWSLTDCISFVIMNQYGLTEALTSDHHFEQAGFTSPFLPLP